MNLTTLIIKEIEAFKETTHERVTIMPIVTLSLAVIVQQFKPLSESKDNI